MIIHGSKPIFDREWTADAARLLELSDHVMRWNFEDLVLTEPVVVENDIIRPSAASQQDLQQEQ